MDLCSAVRNWEGGRAFAPDPLSMHGRDLGPDQARAALDDVGPDEEGDAAADGEARESRAAAATLQARDFELLRLAAAVGEACELQRLAVGVFAQPGHPRGGVVHGDV